MRKQKLSSNPPPVSCTHGLTNQHAFNLYLCAPNSEFICLSSPTILIVHRFFLLFVMPFQHSKLRQSAKHFAKASDCYSLWLLLGWGFLVLLEQSLLFFAFPEEQEIKIVIQGIHSHTSTVPSCLNCLLLAMWQLKCNLCILGMWSEFLLNKVSKNRPLQGNLCSLNLLVPPDFFHFTFDLLPGLSQCLNARV